MPQRRRAPAGPGKPAVVHQHRPRAAGERGDPPGRVAGQARAAAGVLDVADRVRRAGAGVRGGADAGDARTARPRRRRRAGAGPPAASGRRGAYGLIFFFVLVHAAPRPGRGIVYLAFVTQPRLRRPLRPRAHRRRPPRRPLLALPGPRVADDVRHVPGRGVNLCDPSRDRRAPSATGRRLRRPVPDVPDGPDRRHWSARKPTSGTRRRGRIPRRPLSAPFAQSVSCLYPALTRPRGGRARLRREPTRAETPPPRHTIRPSTLRRPACCNTLKRTALAAGLVGLGLASSALGPDPPQRRGRDLPPALLRAPRQRPTARRRATSSVDYQGIGLRRRHQGHHRQDRRLRRQRRPDEREGGQGRRRRGEPGHVPQHRRRRGADLQPPGRRRPQAHRRAHRRHLHGQNLHLERRRPSRSSTPTPSCPAPGHHPRLAHRRQRHDLRLHQLPRHPERRLQAASSAPASR